MNKTIKITAIILAMVLTGCANTTQNQTEYDRHGSIASYKVGKSIKMVLPENLKNVTMYKNGAKDLQSYSSLKNLLSADTAYIGKTNFCKIDEGSVHIETELTYYNSAYQQSDGNYNLVLTKANGEQKILDTDVLSIDCSNNHSIYYRKVVNEESVQFRYCKGKIEEVKEIVGADVAIITHCSNNDKTIGFVSLDNLDNGTSEIKSGYIHNGEKHYYENNSAETYYISEDGEHIYALNFQDNSYLVDVKYVSNKDNCEVKEIANSVTELSIYKDSSAITCLGNVNSEEEKMNPVGELLHYNPSEGNVIKVANDVTAIVESADKVYPWLNENSHEMLITEQESSFIFDKEVCDGQYHYINSEGKLCAANDAGEFFVIHNNFYNPENYVYGEDLYYFSEQNGNFYWSQDDKVYKYKTGTMQAAETITLEAKMLSKIENGLEVGYLITENGEILEQCGNTLVLKDFGEKSDTVYDSAEQIYVIGLSSDGTKIYLANEAKQLLELELKANSSPIVIAENVETAITVENGIYYLDNYNEKSGILNYISYDKKTKKVLAENVEELSATIIQ